MRRYLTAGLMISTLAASGCSTGFLGSHHDERSRYTPGSDEWWAEQGELPPGVRRKWHKGKIWPAKQRSDAPPQQFSHTYYSQHYWPLPYTCQDREAVWRVMDVQTGLGWQEETTLYNRHFDSQTNALTRAGELHLEYILRDVPQERRAVWVQSTFSAEADQTRMESVQAAIAQRVPDFGGIPLAVRECREVGRPAAEVEMISSLYRSSMPAPRLSRGMVGGGGGGQLSSATGAAAGMGNGGGGGFGGGGGSAGGGGTGSGM
ncbi:MAG: hypothetical protein ACKO2P_01740 [Planctomycetota bacterium]